MQNRIKINKRRRKCKYGQEFSNEYTNSSQSSEYGLKWKTVDDIIKYINIYMGMIFLI